MCDDNNFCGGNKFSVSSMTSCMNLKFAKVCYGEGREERPCFFEDWLSERRRGILRLWIWLPEDVCLDFCCLQETRAKVQEKWANTSFLDGLCEGNS